LIGARAHGSLDARFARTRQGSMIRVTVLYPAGPGKRFDMEYYTGRHIPMVKQRLGGALEGAEVYAAVPGAGGAPAPFVATTHLHFESAPAFQAAFGQHAREIMADLPNYTDIAPQVVVEERKV
jgi:uncharacterized protein (TIGR02118 family)